MSPRAPRSPAAPRSDEPVDVASTDDPVTDVPATDDADVERTEAAGDTTLLGAYALGALSPEERADVEERLAASPALQDELRRLLPVAALLREAADSPTSPAADPIPSQRHTPETMAVPSMDVVPSEDSHDDHGPSPSAAGLAPALGDETPPLDPAPDEPDDEAGPSPVRVEATPGSLSSRPARRPARPVREPGPVRPRAARTSTIVAGWPRSWLVAGLASLVAVGAVLWALALVDRLDARRDQVAALEAELGEVRARGDAAVVALAPGEGGPAGADGVVVVAPSEGSLIVRVAGLPASAEGRVYQIWFQDAADGADSPWIVGPVFRVGDGGTALVELPAATPAFTRLALSDEASPGGDVPSGAFLLEGSAANDESGTPPP